MRKPNIASRTRARHWVPRRIYYVLAYLKRQLAPGKARAISNYRIKEALGFGSEGEVSQIMRWLAGEAPTTGRWSYGVLNTPQTYRFIVRERMPSGGYLITLLAVPKLIEEAPPEAVQLCLWDDPSMIPHGEHQDAAKRGSSTHDPSLRLDLPRQDAADQRTQGDQHEETPKESNSSSVGALSQKNDWSTLTIDGAQFLPITALEKAGHTPESVKAADAKIRTRREYTREGQIRILFDCLLNHQPIYSAAEMQARSEEERHERPAERPARSVQSGAAPNRPKRPERHPRRDASPQSHFPAGWGVPAWLTDSDGGGDRSALPVL